MSLTKLEENLSIIENLPDSPTMETTKLKQKFDEGSIKIKDYINEILTVEIDSIVTQIKKEISSKILEDNKKKYYVGKLIFDTKNVNPSTYLGFGTWQLWGQGRVPVGVNPNDNDFKTVEKTGGEKTHKLTLAEIPSHTHTFKGNVTSSAGTHTHTLNNHTHTYSKVNSTTEGHKLTIDEMPRHQHGMNIKANQVAARGNVEWVEQYDSNNITIYTTLTGGDKSHNHEIKTTSASTGSNNGNTSNNGTHTHNISGTNTNSGGDGTHNNLQPYITCYIWKRTA